MRIAYENRLMRHVGIADGLLSPAAAAGSDEWVAQARETLAVLRDAFLDERTRRASAATSLAAAREQALREAAEICGRISEVKATVWRAGLKADSYIEGECDGADECRMAIEALLHPTRDGGE